MMQYTEMTESARTNGLQGAMPGLSAGQGSGDDRSGDHYHHHHATVQQQQYQYQQQKQQQYRPNGSVSPLPRSQSPPLPPGKQYAPQRQQSPLYPPYPQGRALSASQPGSPPLYRVSPITGDSNNPELSVFNPQSPYRSMAPSQSRFFDTAALSSPNDQSCRNTGHEFLASPTSMMSASPPHYRRGMPSSQSTTSLHSPEMVGHASQQSLRLPHAIATAGSSASLGGSASDVTQSAATATSTTTMSVGAGAATRSTPESGFTAVLTNTNHSPYTASTQQGGPPYRGGGVAPAAPGAPQVAAEAGSARSPYASTVPGVQAAPPLSTGDRRESGDGAAVSSSATAETTTFLPRKSVEKHPPTMNGSLDRRPSTTTTTTTTAAAGSSTETPPQRPQVQERAIGSPAPPTHAQVVAVAVPSSPPREAAAAATESTGRWVSPLRPHRAGSTDTSDGFQSPGSVPSSSCETPNVNASGAPLPAPSRSPALYGVIGLPFHRAEASGPPSVSSSRSSNAGRVGLTSPQGTFHASPISSKAPAVVKPRTTMPSSAGAELRSDGGRPSAAEATPTRHADPSSAAAAATPITAHPRSGSSEHSSLYRRSVARNVVSGAREDHPPSEGASAHHQQQQQQQQQPTPVSASPRSTPPPPPPMAFAAPKPLARHDEPVLSARAEKPSHEEGRVHQHQHQQQPQPQRVASLAPAAVVAARSREAANTSAPVADAVRRAVNGVAGGAPAPQLTADIVLPVAAQEELARYSSSTTDATERSSSFSSRVQGGTPSPTSSKSSVRAGAASPLSSARTGGRLSQTTSSLQGSVPRQRCGPLKQQPTQQQQQRPSALSATYASGTTTATASRLTRATAVSADAVPGRTGSAGERRRGSVSSTKSTTPALAGYSFVSSRAHLQRYIDQWRDRGEEDKTAYKEGGYLTVTPGKIVHSRYVLVQKLGWGEFSTVWLAYDTKNATLGRGAAQAFVAVKVAKCRWSVQEATHYEVSLLRYIEARLPPYAAVTNIIDCFEVQGEFGFHTCMAMPLCGPNLLAVIDRVRKQRGRRTADDVRLVKEVLVSVLLSLHELSVLNVVHTDIKPENVLCCAVDTKLIATMEKFCSYNKDRSHMISTEEFREGMAQQTSEHLVCIGDFGLSALLEPEGSAAKWTALCPKLRPSLLAPLMRCKKKFDVTTPGVMDNLHGTVIQTREYRAPEVLLGLDFTCATDIWSVGCMAFELITGSFLMDPKKKTRDEREMDVEHLAMMMQLIGPLPPEVTNIRVRNSDYYDANRGPHSSGAAAGAAGTAASRPPPVYLHRFVDRDGNFIYASRYRAYPRRSLEMELEPYLGFREARLAANFILSCLYCYDPKNRPSARKLLNHQWFQGVGTPTKSKTG